MFNQIFLKQLTILYVEDDDIARMQLTKTLKRLFNNVIQAANGEEGYQLYQEAKTKKIAIDLVLSDINMPKMNGIELLEKIRVIDKELPFIFTTARSETEYLTKAIELNANYYALKPIEIDDIIQRIQEVCQKRYYQEALNDKQKELANYLNAINHVAVIYKINTDGKITFANNSFLELTGYTKEELEQLSLTDILHPSIAKQHVKQTWKHILTGEPWKGNTKYVNKNNKSFYLNITIFKQDDSYSEDEFITLGFVTTQESIKQREFHKKVMLNIKENNLKVQESQKAIQEKSYLVVQLKNYILELEAKNDELSQKNVHNQKQLRFYEEQLDKVQDKRTVSLQEAHQKVKTFSDENQHLKHEKESIKKRADKLNEQVTASAEEMKKLYEVIEAKDKRILDLDDLVKFRESQILMMDASLLNK